MCASNIFRPRLGVTHQSLISIQSQRQRAKSCKPVMSECSQEVIGIFNDNDWFVLLVLIKPDAQQASCRFMLGRPEPMATDVKLAAVAEATECWGRIGSLLVLLASIGPTAIAAVAGARADLGFIA